MRYYFIDLENVNLGGFTGVENVSKGEKIYIFLSKNTCKPNWELTKKLIQQKVDVEIVDCEVGTPNSMDFQVCAILGYVLGKKGARNNEFIIISRDTDFDKTIEMFKNNGVCVNRFIDFNCKEKFLANPKITMDNAEVVTVEKRKPFTKKELLTVIDQSEYSNELISAINAGLQKTSKNRYAQVKIELDRFYRDAKKSNSIYVKIKPLI